MSVDRFLTVLVLAPALSRGLGLCLLDALRFFKALPAMFFSPPCLVAGLLLTAKLGRPFERCIHDASERLVVTSVRRRGQQPGAG